MLTKEEIAERQEQSYQLFHRIRALGVRAHSWI